MATVQKTLAEVKPAVPAVPAIVEVRYVVELTHDEALAVTKVLGRNSSTPKVNTGGVYTRLLNAIGHNEYDRYTREVLEFERECKGW